ncbi:MAG: FitA-like ribbon-helix-helix domain-containing protein, partial [Pseudonocardiaceae bacterium]
VTTDTISHRPGLYASRASVHERMGGDGDADSSGCRCLHIAATACVTGCMASVTIRDVPDETRDELAARAAATGRSLQEYLRSKLIEFADRPDPEALLLRIRERTRRTGSQLGADQILGHRDADRR